MVRIEQSRAIAVMFQSGEKVGPPPLSWVPQIALPSNFGFVIAVLIFHSMDSMKSNEYESWAKTGPEWAGPNQARPKPEPETEYPCMDMHVYSWPSQQGASELHLRRRLERWDMVTLPGRRPLELVALWECCTGERPVEYMLHT